MAGRSTEEIRSSIEANRNELALSLTRLRGEVVELTDWRGQLVRHRREALVGAVAAGFIIGGGMAAIGSLLSRKRRR